MAEKSQWMYDEASWLKLPLKLRNKWWSETDYGRIPPTDELRAEIAAALEAIEQPK